MAPSGIQQRLISDPPHTHKQRDRQRDRDRENSQESQRGERQAEIEEGRKRHIERELSSPSEKSSEGRAR